MTDKKKLDLAERFMSRIAKTPPYNAEVEQALLGAILRNNRAYDIVSDYLRPVHFYVPEHIRLYEYIQTQIQSGQTASPASLSHVVSSDDILNGDVGGTEYLYELVANLATMMNVKDYGRTIYDLHIKRELIGLALDIEEVAYDTTDIDLKAESIVEIASDRLLNLMDGGSTDNRVVTLSEAMAEQIELYSRASQNPDSIGLKSHLPIDDLLIAFMPECLYIVAARPGMGKTAMALDVSKRLQGSSPEGENVLFISLEMSAPQLASRLLSSATGISARDGLRGKLSAAEIDTMIGIQREMQNVPLRFADRAGQSVAGIEMLLRREQHRAPVSALFIDYLGLLDPAEGRSRNNNRNNDVSEMTRGLKRLAKRWKIPVILLSQLSRDVEKREDKRPQMSDLRDSGSIEQDADVVIFLYRDEYYAVQEEPIRRSGETDDKFQGRLEAWEQRMMDAKNVLEVIVSKQRSGPTGTVRLFCDLNTMRFSALDQVHSEGFL